MLGLRFLGIRARLLLLFLVAGLAGAFSLVPLLPSEALSSAYHRIAVVVGLGSMFAAWIARAMVRPIEDLDRTLRQRLVGREVMPPRDRGLDEVHELSETVGRFLTHCDQRDAKARGVAGVGHLETDQELRALLRIAQGMPGASGASGAVGRLLAGVQDFLELEHVSLLIHDETSGQLDLFAAAGLDAELVADLERHGPRPVKYAAGVGVAGIALATGRTKVAPRGRRDKDFARLGGAYEDDIESLACVPIRRDGAVVGVVNAVNTRRAGGFDLNAIEFLEEACRMLESWLPALLGDELSEDLDPLTGVLRFDVWESRFQAELDRHRRFPRGLGMAVVELAYPGADPDSEIRNRTLAEVGALLAREVRRLDLVGREGDRFFLALPETDMLGTIHLSGRIKDAIDRAAVRGYGQAPRFAGLVGVAASPEVIEDAGELMRAAEDAVVEARRAGDYRMACYLRRVA